MCFPVFEKTDTGYTLRGVFLDLDKAIEKCQALGPGHHWEPWPLDSLFEEAFAS